MKHILFAFTLLLLATACNQIKPVITDPKATNEANMDITKGIMDYEIPPNERFGELFEAVQMGKVFPDGKTFVDCAPNKSSKEIMAAYQTAKGTPNFNLAQFVYTHFDTPRAFNSSFKTDTNLSVSEHINSLWDVLTRQPDKEETGSLYSLPHPYIVPGGRFREIYYWDSYFTMLGLQTSGRVDMVENMIKNFAYLIDKIGYIPNGNRTYFLSRSQPPFFGKMVHLLAASKGEETIKEYLPQLEKEYQFWMKGLDQVSAKHVANDKVVYLDKGVFLNRYWDKGDYPRAESYREDKLTVEETARPSEEVYRDLRSACESGWDFSSRWFKDTKNLETIHTTDIIPIDLNTLLYDLEKLIARGYALTKNKKQEAFYNKRAKQRAAAIQKYCWNEAKGFFMDYDFRTKQTTTVPSLAGLFPLESKIASQAQAVKVAQFVEANFLHAGGVVSTLNATGEQWDYPNGWAPLQWMTIEGLNNYEQTELANTIAERWIALNTKIFKKSGKLLEKYNVVDMDLETGGGEYPVQDGFGWTNGVLLKLLDK